MESGEVRIQKLKEIDPAVKAVVSSGYSFDPAMADYRKYGFSGILAKPYKIKDLGDLLQRLLHPEEFPIGIK
jgi:DNA-binding NtrC family response regulator